MVVRLTNEGKVARDTFSFDAEHVALELVQLTFTKIIDKQRMLPKF